MTGTLNLEFGCIYIGLKDIYPKVRFNATSILKIYTSATEKKFNCSNIKDGHIMYEFLKL